MHNTSVFIRIIVCICSIAIGAIASAAGESYLVIDEQYSLRGRIRASSITNALGPAKNLLFVSKDDIEAFAAERKSALRALYGIKNCALDVLYGEPDEEGIITVTFKITVKDTDPAVLEPDIHGDTNGGFRGTTSVIFPDLEGTLQHMAFSASYTAPKDANDDTRWNDPDFRFDAEWGNIHLGKTAIGFAGSFFSATEIVRDSGIPVVVSKSTKAELAFTMIYREDEHLSNIARYIGTWTQDQNYLDDFAPDYGVYTPDIFAFTMDSVWKYASWKNDGALRGGFEGSFLSTNIFHFSRYNGLWTTMNFGVEISRYIQVGNFLDPGIRANAQCVTGNPSLCMAKLIRGVADSDLAGNYGFFCSAEIRARIIRTKKTEIIATPFFDAGIVGRNGGQPDFWTNAFGTGCAIEIYSADFREPLISCWAGYSLNPKAGKQESHRIEANVSISLTY